MLTLAGLFVTAILAPAPGAAPELRAPAMKEVAIAPATDATCPCRCADDGLREPFPRGPARSPGTRSALAGAELRDPFDAPRRATPAHAKQPLPPRIRVSAPAPASTGGELRTPFGRA